MLLEITLPAYPENVARTQRTPERHFSNIRAIRARELLAASAGRVEVHVTKDTAVVLAPPIVVALALSLGHGRAIVVEGRSAATTQTAQRPVIAPDPRTQAPEHKVTSEQMKKWEKDLSNWGRWGQSDERGTLNLITAEKTRSAMRLVKDAVFVSLHKYPDLTRQIDSWSFGETVHRMTNIASPFTALATF